MKRWLCLVAVLLSGCAAKKPVRQGCSMVKGKPVCVCRSIEILSLDVKNGETILKCTH